VRRFVAPVGCAVLLAACVIGAASSGALAGSGPGSVGGGAQPVTPVLSARRVPGLLASLAADASLRSQLDGIVMRSPTATCLGVEADGRSLYGRNLDIALLPASNEKLLTATAALQVLGPSTRLRTTVVTKSKPDAAGAIHGDLYLVGGGDPLLSTAAYRDALLDPTLTSSMETLADRIVAAGVHRVDGRIIGDESRYDSQRTVASWLPSYTATHEVGPLSALTVNDGWTAFPSKSAPTVQLTAAPDPAKSAADVLSALLAARGVTVGNGTASGPAPAGSAELAHLDSLPVNDLLREMLTISDNNTAELLVKELGHKAGAGTTTKGVAVLQQTLDGLGLDRSGTVQIDGSGLDRGNRVTCRLLLRILDRAGPTSPLAAALPIAGKTGTLKPRFLGTAAIDRLRAKTGTLDDTSALSGFVATIPGSTVTFAYVANGRIVNKSQLQVEQDLGIDLVGYPQGVEVPAIGPAPAK